MQRHWWWRLQFLRWQGAGRNRPLLRAASLMLWWIPCLLAPAILAFHSAYAGAALDFLLSIDIPLAWLLAVGVVLDALHVASLRGAEDWLWPRALRPARVRWLARLRWLQLARWPAGFVLAVLLLSAGATAQPSRLAGLLWLALFALLGGLAFSWAMPHMRVSGRQPRPSRPRFARGLAALSWVALREASERFDTRRMMVLSLPVLLAAPRGVLANDVARTLALYLPVMFLVMLCRECAQLHAALLRWMPARTISRARLACYMWRHVATGLLVLLGAWLLWPSAPRRLLAPPP